MRLYGKLLAMFALGWAWTITCALLPIPLAAAGDLKVNSPAPEFSAKTLGDTTFSLAGKNGRVTLLHFWATWCEACQAEMYLLDDYYKKNHSHGLDLLAVNMDDDNSEAVIAQAKKYSFPTALKKNCKISKYGRIWRLPMTFVIDREGILRLNRETANDPKLSLRILEEQVSPLLNSVTVQK